MAAGNPPLLETSRDVWQPIHDRKGGLNDDVMSPGWEIDTVHGGGLKSIVTLIDRKSGFVQID